MIRLIYSAKICGNPPETPPGATAALVQSGSKYGPVCPEYHEPRVLNDNCPEIRCEIQPNFYTKKVSKLITNLYCFLKLTEVCVKSAKSFPSFKMREGKDFGSDRIVTFDVIIAPEAGSDMTAREVFFVVELSSKPKSFGVSIKGKKTFRRSEFIKAIFYVTKSMKCWLDPRNIEIHMKC